MSALVVSCFALTAAPASATHDGLPSSVSLAAEKTEVTIPEPIRLTATANRHLYGSGYTVVILDQDGAAVGNPNPCSNAAACVGTGNGTTWANNPDPQPQTFHAELRGPGGSVVATSNYVTVNVRKFMWEIVSVVPTPQSKVVPGTIHFASTVNRSVYNTGYRIYMYDEDDPSSPAICGGGTECGKNFVRQWRDNVSPKPGRVRVEVRRPSGDLASPSVQAQATFRRFMFTVDLSFSTQTNTNGTVTHKATGMTAAADPSLYGTPYQIKIKKADGTQLCSAPQVGCTAPVNVGQTYRAVVEDSAGRNFGDSGAWTLTADGPRQDVVDDVDLAHLAALFPTSEAVCNALTEYPGSHFMEPPSSLSDQYRICVIATNAGKSKLEVLRDVATGVGGAAALGALWYLQREGVRPSPAPGTPSTPEEARAPRPVPLPLVPQVNRLADTLVQQNPISQPIADELAWQCQWLTAPLALNANRECAGQPVFVSGADVPTATEHDLRALAHWPAWVGLNYRPAAETPGARAWYLSQPECASLASGEGCDEYPFWASMQGGPFAVKRPHLEPIDADDNTNQGGLYGNFVTICHMNTGDAFLGVPLPPELGIPTQTRVCNGH
jgi:hypothetical protein